MDKNRQLRHVDQHGCIQNPLGHFPMIFAISFKTLRLLGIFSKFVYLERVRVEVSGLLDFQTYVSAENLLISVICKFLGSALSQI